MRVCVFGAAGFIGSRTVKCLIKNGHEINALVRSPEKQAAVADLGADPIIGDLANTADVANAMKRSDAVINLAVPPYLGRVGMSRIRRMAKEFVRNVENILDEARRQDLPVILSEGTLIWGDSGTGWHDEGAAFKPWGMGRIGELSTPLTEARIAEGAPIVRLISGLTYGAGSWFEHIIYDLMRKGWFRTYGDGTNTFSFVYVEDVADAYRLAIEKLPVGESFAIVDDVPTTLKEFCDCTAGEMDKKPVKTMPTWMATLISGRVVVEEMTMNCRVRNSKARRDLGWQPSVTYAEGIPLAIKEIEQARSLTTF